MSKDQTITVTVKPEIDREAVEEAAQLAAALFLSSFAVAVLDGITGEEPPEDVLARVKAETLEKAAQEGRLRPATPADLAEHGVDEQGQPVGKGETDALTITLERHDCDMTAAEARKAARIARGITDDSTATRLLDAYATAIEAEAGER